MSCIHCPGKDIPDGLTCAFCLGDDDCGCHADIKECLSEYRWTNQPYDFDEDRKVVYQEPTVERDIEQAVKLIEDGHEIFAFCGNCGSACALCDEDDCTQEAYKFVDNADGTVFYYCEQHHDAWRPPEHFDKDGDVLEEFEDMDEPDYVVMYHPGSGKIDDIQGCPACDFPY